MALKNGRNQRLKPLGSQSNGVAKKLHLDIVYVAFIAHVRYLINYVKKIVKVS